MSIPPANHREAMLRSDAEEWKRVEGRSGDAEEYGLLRG